MKKGKLLHPEISRLIAEIGHKQLITLADAGLPIPNEVNRVDLAVTQGIPSLMPVFKAVTSEMQLEKVILAEEITTSVSLHKEILASITQLSEIQNKTIEIDYISHDEFKKLTWKSQAIIRTGEITPYANIILVSGVTF